MLVPPETRNTIGRSLVAGMQRRKTPRVNINESA